MFGSRHLFKENTKKKEKKLSDRVWLSVVVSSRPHFRGAQPFYCQRPMDKAIGVRSAAAPPPPSPLSAAYFGRKNGCSFPEELLGRRGVFSAVASAGVVASSRRQLLGVPLCFRRLSVSCSASAATEAVKGILVSLTCLLFDGLNVCSCCWSSREEKRADDADGRSEYRDCGAC